MSKTDLITRTNAVEKVTILDPTARFLGLIEFDVVSFALPCLKKREMIPGSPLYSHVHRTGS